MALGDTDGLKSFYPFETASDGRFIAYDNGTVLDTKTGLMWVAKDNGVNISCKDAKTYCEDYNGGWYTDWRMPTRVEWAGIFHYRVLPVRRSN